MAEPSGTEPRYPAGLVLLGSPHGQDGRFGKVKRWWSVCDGKQQLMQQCQCCYSCPLLLTQPGAACPQVSSFLPWEFTLVIVNTMYILPQANMDTALCELHEALTQFQVRSAERITHTELPDLQTIYYKRCQTKARRTVKDPTHPNNRLFSLLRLTVEARAWGAMLVTNSSPLLNDYPSVIQELKAVFHHPRQGKICGQALLCLRQGTTLPLPARVAEQRGYFASRTSQAGEPMQLGVAIVRHKPREQRKEGDP
ncbi:hypothetical protein P4O66_018635, partial [Electrophorus voltai]